MSKTDIWDRVSKTDPKEVKPITGKDYGGNSPKPYYIVKRLTEEFGPCGIGWGYEILSQGFERFSDTDSLHVCHLRFWFNYENARGVIEQMGQTKATYVTSKGTFKIDEDAPKKSVTDALVKCASYLGFAGDIFSGRWDDSKYVAELRKEFAPPASEQTPPVAKSVSQDTFDRMEPEEQDFLTGIAREAKIFLAKADPDGALAYLKSQNLNADEQVAINALFDSSQRSAMKRAAQQPKEQATA